MKIISVRPAATASSTAYWMSGLSTIGIISFGLALVAGRKRLPKPATGNTAFVIARIAVSSLQERSQTLLVEHRHAERLGPGELGARVGAGHNIVGLLRDRAADLAAMREYQLARLFPRHVRQRPGEHERLPRGAPLRGRARCTLVPGHPRAAERADHLPVVALAEEPVDRGGDHGADVGHL